MVPAQALQVRTLQRSGHFGPNEKGRLSRIEVRPPVVWGQSRRTSLQAGAGRALDRESAKCPGSLCARAHAVRIREVDDTERALCCPGRPLDEVLSDRGAALASFERPPFWGVEDEGKSVSNCTGTRLVPL